jgi:hypothetical protein
LAYYTTNAVYQELEKYYDGSFVWTSGSAWILLYSDSAASVKALVFVSGNSSHGLNSEADARLLAAEAVARKLAIAGGVPFATILFDDVAVEIDHVQLDTRLVTLSELKNWFFDKGLDVKTGSTGKAINSQESSAYHNWQRANLGAISVTDIDLIRLNDDRKRVIQLIELKRSFYSLSKWSPYPADFSNFNAIESLASRVDAEFLIVYNVRYKNPWLDDASSLSIFSYSESGGPVSLGVKSINDFRIGL